MQNDKKSLGSLADDSLTPDEEQKLEVKVDKMLDPRLPNSKTEASKGLPPIDILSDPKTAPDVPEAVMETIVGSGANTEEDQAKAAVGTDVATPLDTTKSNPSDALDDEQIDKAVDDITVHESDEVLAAQDAEITKAFEPAKTGRKGKVRALFAAWWHNKKIRYSTLVGIVILLVLLAVVPVIRAFALNLVGVRGTATLTVLDNTTQLPLKNVHVSLGGANATTNSSGDVTLQHVRLGSQHLKIQQVAFASIDKPVSVTWGSNNLGSVPLVAVGTQYKFTVVDYVSGHPITSARASSGASNAEADNKGNIVLTFKDPSTSTLQVSISAEGYNTATVSIAIGTKGTTTVQLVSSRKEVFISKQTGTYNVYSSDIDGQHKKLLLAGTGNESAAQLTLISDAPGGEAALISTRDNIRDSGGYLEEALTVINVSTGSATTIDHSDRIQPVDWVGDYLVYVEVKPGASAANPSRYLLMSYNYATNERLQLDHANYFNDIVSANGVIYYATSNQYGGGISQFNRINPNNTGKQTLLNNDIWNIFRTDYNDFALSSATGWYTYKLGAAQPTPTTSAYNGTSRLYIDSPDGGKHSAWVDTRDGKGALIIYDSSTGKETTLTEQGGLTYPVTWLDDDTLIYRVSTSQDTADYVVSLQGGGSKKITDVTNASGITLWYYY